MPLYFSRLITLMLAGAIASAQASNETLLCNSFAELSRKSRNGHSLVEEVGLLADPTGPTYLQGYTSTEPRRIAQSALSFWEKKLGVKVYTQTDSLPLYMSFGPRGTMLDAVFAFTQAGDSVSVTEGSSLVSSTSLFGRKIVRSGKAQLYIVDEEAMPPNSTAKTLDRIYQDNPEAKVLLIRDSRNLSAPSYLASRRPFLMESVNFSPDADRIPSPVTVTMGHPDLIGQIERSSEYRGAWTGRFDQIALRRSLEETLASHANPHAVEFSPLPSPTTASEGHLASEFLDLFPGFRQRNYDTALNLGLGQPSVEISKSVLTQTIEQSKIPEAPGAAEAGLKQQVTRWYREKYAVPLGKSMAVSEGVSGAVFQMLSTLPRGSTIGVPDLAYNTYAHAAKLNGIKVVQLPLSVKDIQALKEPPPGVDALVINFPHNPTGEMLSPEARSNLQRLAREKGLLVINDLSYTRFSYTSRPVESLLTGSAEHKNLVEIFSTSKDIGLPETRVSVTVGDPRWVEAMQKVSHLDHPSPFRMRLVENTLRDPKVFVSDQQEMKARRDLILEAFRKIGWPESLIQVPEGGENVMLSLPPGVDSREVATKLWFQSEVMVMPGKFFLTPNSGRSDFIRVSLSETSTQLKKLLPRLIEKKIKFSDLVQSRPL